MDTEEYLRKPLKVAAVRVTADNIHDVANWCSGKITENAGDDIHIEVEVARTLSDRQKKAYVGDWVLLAGTGYKVYTNRAFHNSFDKVEAKAKAPTTTAVSV